MLVRHVFIFQSLAAAIANLFAKEKDELKQEVSKKNDKIDELKLKCYRLENEINALKLEAKVNRNFYLCFRLRWSAGLTKKI